MQHLDLLIQTDGSFGADLDADLGAARTPAMPSLHKLLRRGKACETPRGLCEAICVALGIHKQLDWPVAALTAHAENWAEDTLQADAYWLRLDPLHLDVGMRGMFARSMVLSETEASEFNQVLASILQPLFAERGLHFELQFIAGQQGAYVQLQDTPDLRTTPLDELDGRQPTAFLPTGADAKTWLWLLNEVQIGLHTHPFNDSRISRGLLPINGVWVWGGGDSGGDVQAVSPAIKVIYSSNTNQATWLGSLAKASGLESHTAPDDLNTLINSRYSHAMAVIDARQTQPSVLEANWFAPLLRALYWGQLRSVKLTLLHDDAQAVSLTPQQAWRFWK